MMNHPPPNNQHVNDQPADPDEIQIIEPPAQPGQLPPIEQILPNRVQVPPNGIPIQFMNPAQAQAQAMLDAQEARAKAELARVQQQRNALGAQVYQSNLAHSQAQGQIVLQHGLIPGTHQRDLHLQNVQSQLIYNVNGQQNLGAQMQMPPQHVPNQNMVPMGTPRNPDQQNTPQHLPPRNPSAQDFQGPPRQWNVPPHHAAQWPPNLSEAQIQQVLNYQAQQQMRQQMGGAPQNVAGPANPIQPDFTSPRARNQPNPQAVNPAMRPVPQTPQRPNPAALHVHSPLLAQRLGSQAQQHMDPAVANLQSPPLAQHTPPNMPQVISTTSSLRSTPLPSSHQSPALAPTPSNSLDLSKLLEVAASSQQLLSQLFPGQATDPAILNQIAALLANPAALSVLQQIQQHPQVVKNQETTSQTDQGVQATPPIIASMSDPTGLSNRLPASETNPMIPANPPHNLHQTPPRIHGNQLIDFSMVPATRPAQNAQQIHEPIPQRIPASMSAVPNPEVAAQRIPPNQAFITAPTSAFQVVPPRNPGIQSQAHLQGSLHGLQISINPNQQHPMSQAYHSGVPHSDEEKMKQILSHCHPTFQAEFKEFFHQNPQIRGLPEQELIGLFTQHRIQVQQAWKDRQTGIPLPPHLMQAKPPRKRKSPQEGAPKNPKAPKAPKTQEPKNPKKKPPKPLEVPVGVPFAAEYHPDPDNPQHIIRIFNAHLNPQGLHNPPPAHLNPQNSPSSAPLHQSPRHHPYPNPSMAPRCNSDPNINSDRTHVKVKVQQYGEPGLGFQMDQQVGDRPVEPVSNPILPAAIPAPPMVPRLPPNRPAVIPTASVAEVQLILSPNLPAAIPAHSMVQIPLPNPTSSPMVQRSPNIPAAPVVEVPPIPPPIIPAAPPTVQTPPPNLSAAIPAPSMVQRSPNLPAAPPIPAAIPTPSVVEVQPILPPSIPAAPPTVQIPPPNPPATVPAPPMVQRPSPNFPAAIPTSVVEVQQIRPPSVSTAISAPSMVQRPSPNLPIQTDPVLEVQKIPPLTLPAPIPTPPTVQRGSLNLSAAPPMAPVVEVQPIPPPSIPAPVPEPSMIQRSPNLPAVIPTAPVVEVQPIPPPNPPASIPAPPMVQRLPPNLPAAPSIVQKPIPKAPRVPHPMDTFPRPTIEAFIPPPVSINHLPIEPYARSLEVQSRMGTAPRQALIPASTIDQMSISQTPSPVQYSSPAQVTRTSSDDGPEYASTPVLFPLSQSSTPINVAQVAMDPREEEEEGAESEDIDVGEPMAVVEEEDQPTPMGDQIDQDSNDQEPMNSPEGEDQSAGIQDSDEPDDIKPVLLQNPGSRDIQQRQGPLPNAFADPELFAPIAAPVVAQVEEEHEVITLSDDEGGDSNSSDESVKVINVLPPVPPKLDQTVSFVMLQPHEIVPKKKKTSDVEDQESAAVANPGIRIFPPRRSPTSQSNNPRGNQDSEAALSGRTSNPDALKSPTKTPVIRIFPPRQTPNFQSTSPRGRQESNPSSSRHTSNPGALKSPAKTPVIRIVPPRQSPTFEFNNPCDNQESEPSSLGQICNPEDQQLASRAPVIRLFPPRRSPTSRSTSPRGSHKFEPPSSGQTFDHEAQESAARTPVIRRSQPSSSGQTSNPDAQKSPAKTPIIRLFPPRQSPNFQFTTPRNSQESVPFSSTQKSHPEVLGSDDERSPVKTPTFRSPTPRGSHDSVPSAQPSDPNPNLQVPDFLTPPRSSEEMSRPSTSADPEPELIQFMVGGLFRRPIPQHKQWKEASDYSKQSRIRVLLSQCGANRYLFQEDYYSFPQPVHLPPSLETLKEAAYNGRGEVKEASIYQELQDLIRDEQNRQIELGYIYLVKTRKKKDPQDPKTPKAPKEPKVPAKRGRKPRKSKKKKVDQWARSADKDYRTPKKPIFSRDFEKRTRAEVSYGGTDSEDEDD